MVTPEPPAGAPATRVPQSPRFAAMHRWLARFKGPTVAIASVGAVLSGLVGYYTTYRTVAGTSPAASVAAPGAEAVNPLSILVLPFVNQTGDASKGYIADALTTSISADLNRIRDALVVPVASAFTYKDKNLTVAQVAKDAGVRFVLQGSVVASGDKLRINAQLTDAQSGKQLWNETFEGASTQLFDLQDLVTARIGNSIGPEMVVVAARESEKRKSSPKVADLMMRQRALGLKPQSTELFNQREPLLRAIIQQEPDNAEALATLAANMAGYAENVLGKSSPRYQSMLTEAKALALRAKAIDDQLPDIYYALASHADTIDKDRAEVRRIIDIAVKVAPKDPLAYAVLSTRYYYDGQPEKTVELLNKALALYPKGSARIFSNLSRAYLMLGDNAAAVDWGLRAVDRGAKVPSTFAHLAMAYSNLGQMDKASHYANEYRQRASAAGRMGGIEKLYGNELPARVSYYNERYAPEWRKAGLPE